MVPFHKPLSSHAFLYVLFSLYKPLLNLLIIPITVGSLNHAMQPRASYYDFYHVSHSFPVLELQLTLTSSANATAQRQLSSQFRQTLT